ncbi:MAG: SPOR domain-containing protein [Marinicella sp.]
MYRPTSLLLKIFMLFPLTLLSWQGISADATEEATADTEIICFAAQKKWVCAPADQQQKAHEKAIKLAQEKPVDSQVSQTDQVEIKVLDMNQNIGAQVQEEPAQISSGERELQQAIQDFIPRDDVQNEAVVQTETTQNDEQAADNTTVQEAAENEPSDTVTVAQTPLPPTQNNEQATTRPTPIEAKTDFNYWQTHFAENWSFQVIGTSNRHHLDQFLADHGLLNTTYSVVKTQANGADWWVVLAGIYDSRDHALSQRDQLPSQLASNAWVRQIKTIVGQAD